VIDLLDTDKCVRHRLYRGDCVHIEDCYVKDLRVLGRDMAKTAVVDNNIANFGYQVSRRFGYLCGTFMVRLWPEV
jgi:CTD small phosphatase-like protein 2